MAAAMLAGCGKEPPSPPPEPPLPAIPDLGLPEGAIDRDAFLELSEAPPAAEPFRWDFSPGRRAAYDLSQKVHQLIVGTAGGGKGVVRAADRNAGRIDLAALPNGTAHATVVIKTESSVVDGRPVPPEEIGKNPATRFQCALRDDGSFADLRPVSGISDPKLLLDALFSLREGERAAPGARFRTTRGGAFKVRRYECVRLVTEFELASEAPALASKLRGRAVAYFAWRERLFVRAEAAIVKSTRSKSQNEQGLWIVSSVDEETVLRADLVE